MASYTQQCNELNVKLEELRKKALEKKQDEKEVQQYVNRIQATIKQYQDIVNNTLGKAVDSLFRASTSMTSARQQQAWEDLMENAGDKSFDLFSKLDDKKENAFNKFALRQASQGAKFFKQLSKMDLAEIQGQLMEETKNLQEEKDDLEREWRDAEGRIKPETQKILDAAEELKEIFEKVSEQTAQASRRLVDWGEGCVRALIGLFVPPGSDIDQFISNVRQLEDKTEAVARVYETAYRKNSRTLTMIVNTRSMVMKFLDKTNLDVLKRVVTETKSKAKGIAGALKDGQGKDGGDFADDAGSAVEYAMRTYEDEYRKFIDKYKGIFVGPVGSHVIEKLLKGYEIENEIERAQGMNIESALRRYYEDAEEIEDIRLDDLDDESKREFKRRVRQELKKYKDEVKKATIGLRDAIKMTRQLSVKDQEEILKRSKGYE